MDVCSQCGHELGIGRFCTNCGHPVGDRPLADTSPGPASPPPVQQADWRTDTAERPRAVPPSPPPPSAPPTATTPAPARYPLFADEAAPAAPAATDETGPEPEPEPEAETTSRHRHVDETRRHGAAAGWVPWVAGLTAMLLLAALGLWLLLRGDEDPQATEQATDPVRTEQPSGDSRTPEGRATLAPVPEVKPGDLADSAAVRAPRPAPATQDVTGRPVTFVAAHLLDGVPQTCWRMPGDGTGESITFSFDEPVEMTEVGLVNGYAKTASDASGSYDWYAGNRRTLQVEWTFDDGTMVSQDLRETRAMQTVALDDGVVTEQVTMRLIEVSPPGTGPASRDYTAISEVSLRGAAAP